MQVLSVCVQVTGAQPTGATTGTQSLEENATPPADMPLLSEAAELALGDIAGDAAGTVHRLLLSVLQRSPSRRPTALATLELVQDAIAQIQATPLS
jgi:hypothetical protein